MSNSFKKYPCVFRGSFVRNEIDPRVQHIWEKRFGSDAPFGRLRTLFRERHCAELNPYGSDSCPYSEQDCAIAFYKCVVVTCGEGTAPGATDSRRATGYFRSVARSSAMYRADNKPLARNRDVAKKAEEGPGNARDANQGSEEGRGVHGTRSRPVSIGDVLRSLDIGPRQGLSDDGETSTE